MKILKRLRRIPEAGLVLLAGWGIPLLSRRAIHGFAGFIGRLLYRFDRKHYDIAVANLDLAFAGKLSDEEKDTLIRQVFRNQALVMLDLFWFNRDTHKRLVKYVKCDESFDAVLDAYSPVLVTAHISNWEVISLMCGLRGGRFTSIFMKQKNKAANRLLNELRQKTGSKIVKREGGLRALLQSMKEGRGTGLLLDQNTLPHEGGVFVPFFGVPVPVSNVTGVFMKRANAKLFMVWCVPDDDGIYRIYARDPYPNGAGNAKREDITARVTLELESIIRDNPAHWIWTYKRWRFYRDSDERSLFPAYAESYSSYVRYLNLKHNYAKAKESGDPDAIAASWAELDAVNQEERRKRRRRRRMKG